MNFLLKLKPVQYQAIIESGYDLDMVYLLALCTEGKDLPPFIDDSCVQSLFDRGLIDESNYVTLKGRKEFERLANIGKGKKSIKPETSYSHEFIKWWESFPSTDNIVQNGKILFKGSRALRTGKSDCEKKLSKILSEGIYTIDDLIRVLKYEVQQKIRKSKDTGVNKLSYMQNSLTYLNNRTFENFMEISKMNETVEQPKFNTVLI